ncbi:MAG: sulfatase [Bacteroidetes bacterium]|nr:sulfatase [Bacteroidota bacterium]
MKDFTEDYDDSHLITNVTIVSPNTRRNVGSCLTVNNLLALIITIFWFGCSHELEKEKTFEEVTIVDIRKEPNRKFLLNGWSFDINKLMEKYSFLNHLEDAAILTQNEKYVGINAFTINDDRRAVIFAHPNSEVIFNNVFIRKNSKLSYGIGVNPDAWHMAGDGVLFEILSVDEKSRKSKIFSKYIDPKNNINDRKWFDKNINLNDFEEQKVSFIFKTTSGPKGDNAADWSGWSNPQVISYRNKTVVRSMGKTSKIQIPISEISDQEVSLRSRGYRSIKGIDDYKSLIDNDRKEVLFQPPYSTIIFKDILINENASLTFGIGIDKRYWDNTGVLFEISVSDQTSQVYKIFTRYIDLRNNENDRGWFDYNVDLKDFIGNRLSFEFKTKVSDKNYGGNCRAMWKNPQIKFGEAQQSYSFLDSLKSAYLIDEQAQMIEVSVNDKPLTSLNKIRHWNEKSFIIPAFFLKKEGINTLTFKYPKASHVVFDYIGIKSIQEIEIDRKNNNQERDKSNNYSYEITEIFKRISSMSQKPNIIVYLLDALRADHLSVYGYHRPTSPYIDKLAKEGILFDNAFAQATYTQASVMSFFTSRYPTFVRSNGKLPEKYKTIASVLREEGYQTAAISTNIHVSKVFGMTQGFDNFMNIPPFSGIPTWETNDSARNITYRLSHLFEEFTKSRRPFFLYLHSINPHSPYRAPDPYFNTFRNNNRIPVNSSNDNLIKIQKGEVPITINDKDDLIDQYDGNILFNDDEIRNLMNILEKFDLIKSTVLIIMSDHGEEFLDHGGILHSGKLFDELIHVPLIIWNPVIFNKPKKISTPVELIDLMPTIIDLALIQNADSFQMEGRSLLYLLDEDSTKPKEVYSYENRFGVEVVSVRDSQWKYIYSPKGMGYGIGKSDTIEWLFNLERDPYELENKADNEKELATKFREQVLTWLEVKKVKTLDNLPNVTIDEATKEKLKSLGYIK